VELLTERKIDFVPPVPNAVVRMEIADDLGAMEHMHEPMMRIRVVVIKECNQDVLRHYSGPVTHK
jgi:hypothetical protein